MKFFKNLPYFEILIVLGIVTLLGLMVVGGKQGHKNANERRERDDKMMLEMADRGYEQVVESGKIVWKKAKK